VWTGWLVFVSAALTVLVTAAYATRLWLRAFFGRAVKVSHDPPDPRMTGPLVLLAAATVVLGVVGLVGGWLPSWLGTNVALDPAPESALVSLSATGAGFLLVYGAWRRDPRADPVTRLRRAGPVLADAFQVDAVYDRVVVRPVAFLARATRRTDDDVVDAAVEGSGGAARLFGGALRLSQNGNVQTYLTGLLAGVVVLAVGVVTLT
jgi:NADH-quinone oxidoreductase subunit L